MPPKTTKLRPRSRAHLISAGVVRGLLRPASLWLLAALTWPVAASEQQNSMRACNLLTPTELSSAIGGSIGHPTGIFTPKNPRPDRNGDFWCCQERVGRPGGCIFFITSQWPEHGRKPTQYITNLFPMP